MSKRQRVAGNIVVCDTNQSIATEKDVIQARIRARAFEISLNRGHAGREVDDWLAAESDVIMSPPVEVAEKEGTFIVRMPAPGIDPSALTVMTTRDQLLVKADFRHEHEPDADIHTCEFKSAVLFRTIDLPSPIESRTLEIQLTDGVLRLTARREGMEVAQPKKKPAAKLVPAKKNKAS